MAIKSVVTDVFANIGVIASMSVTGQGADIPSTILCTPVVGGLYRLTIYSSALTGAGLDTPPNINYSFTDKAGAQSIGSAGTNKVSGLASVTVPVTATDSLSYGSVPLQLVAGQHVSFSVVGGTYVSLTYTFYISLERIS